MLGAGDFSAWGLEQKSSEGLAARPHPAAPYPPNLADVARLRGGNGAGAMVRSSSRPLMDHFNRRSSVAGVTGENLRVTCESAVYAHGEPVHDP